MNSSSLAARLSQQVSATYARNNFKEVNEKAVHEGMCIIMRKSTPFTIILSVAEYERLQSSQSRYEEYQRKLHAPAKKITLEELRKNSVFKKFEGCMSDDFPGLTSVEIAKKWTDYVD